MVLLLFLPRVLLLLLLLLSPSILGIVGAFVLPPIATRCKTTITSLNEATGNDNDDGTGDDTPSFDVEQSRKRLEHLFSDDNVVDGSSSSNNNNKKGGNNDNNDATKKTLLFSEILSEYNTKSVDFSLSSFPPPPPLSSIERDRKNTEIKLLECLVDGDDAVPELWNHWYSERGSSGKARLEAIGGLLVDPSHWRDCENRLVELVDEFGIYFVEPVNLLATLYYLQGKLDLSYKLCELVLVLKPYHIGALSGIVQVALGLNDPHATRIWASKRLPKAPPPPTAFDDNDDAASASTYSTTAFNEPPQEEKTTQVEHPRRVEWVERAIANAMDQLEEAERRTEEDFFGKPEVYYDNGSRNDSDEDEYRATKARIRIEEDASSSSSSTIRADAKSSPEDDDELIDDGSTTSAWQ